MPVWGAGHAWRLAGACVGVGGRLWLAAPGADGSSSHRRRTATALGRCSLLVLLCAAGRLGGWAARPASGQVPGNWPSWSTAAVSATPEFIAVLLGLVLYTAAFVAEVVRAGIQSVPSRPEEAAGALGLSQRQQMRLVVLPQALRVIIPPMTNQYLNLTKNSSLAVAIGYPDVVSIANTTINQTGRAVECIAIIMLVYLTTSLTTSAFMNWYNKRVAIKER